MVGGAPVAWPIAGIRRRHASASAFFQEGNLEREVQAKQWGQSSLQPNDVRMRDGIKDEDEGEWAEDEGDEAWCEEGDEGWSCEVCSAPFSNMHDYEQHYEVQHKHVCDECQCRFPSSRFLECHIEERHDTYFAMLKEKRASFSCVVDGCSILSWSLDTRLEHLTSAHRFPSDWTLDDLSGSHFCDAAADSGVGGTDADVCLDLSALSLQ
jgi:hypothetical protein